MKQSKLMLAIELAYVAYMLAILWFLFPQWHGAIAAVWRSVFWRWQQGHAILRLTALPTWAQEAAVVRGKLPHVDRPFPRPLNLPE